MIKRIFAALTAALLLFCCFSCSAPKTGETVTFTLSVTHSDGGTREFEITTDKTTLQDALTEQKLISGDITETGMFVTTVDGETVDFDANESWWKLLKNGEQTTVGVAGCAVAEGDSYEFIYTVGY